MFGLALLVMAILYGAYNIGKDMALRDNALCDAKPAQCQRWCGCTLIDCLQERRKPRSKTSSDAIGAWDFSHVSFAAYAAPTNTKTDASVLTSVFD